MHSTPHTNPAAPITSTILLPGDPPHAKFITETYLEDTQQFNTVRNVLSCTSTCRGTPAFVMGPGMGISSTSLYAHELIHEFGYTRLVRVGTYGTLQPDVNLYGVVIAQAACSNSAFPDQYQIPGSYAPIGSFRLIDNVVCRAREADIPIHVGNILSSDTLYNANPTFNETWQRMDVLAIEMESTGLYATTAHAGIEAVDIFTVSDSLMTGEATDAQARQTSSTIMMGLALPLTQL